MVVEASTWPENGSGGRIGKTTRSSEASSRGGSAGFVVNPTFEVASDLDCASTITH